MIKKVKKLIKIGIAGSFILACSGCGNPFDLSDLHRGIWALRAEGFVVNDYGGNRDGKLNPGESVALYLKVRNTSDKDITSSVWFRLDSPNGILEPNGPRFHPAEIESFPAGSVAATGSGFEIRSVVGSSGSSGYIKIHASSSYSGSYVLWDSVLVHIY